MVKDLMVFTIVAGICAVFGLFYVFVKQVDRQLVVTLWVTFVPLLVLFFVGLCMFGRKKQPVAKADESLWSVYCKLEEFYGFISDLSFKEKEIVVDNVEIDVLVESDAQVLYEKAIEAHEALVADFTESNRQYFVDCLSVYYQYINVRFCPERVNVLRDIVVKLDDIDRDVKFLVLKNLTQIANINNECNFVGNRELLDSFDEDFYKKYVVQQFYLAEGFVEWLSDLLLVVRNDLSKKQ